MYALKCYNSYTLTDSILESYNLTKTHYINSKNVLAIDDQCSPQSSVLKIEKEVCVLHFLFYYQEKKYNGIKKGVVTI